MKKVSRFLLVNGRSEKVKIPEVLKKLEYFSFFNMFFPNTTHKTKIVQKNSGILKF